MADQRLIEWYGWVPDIPDQRDFRYSVPQAVAADLPTRVDLRADCPPVFEQMALGSCTANAIVAAHMFGQKKQGAAEIVTLSRLFVYWNERNMEGTVGVDAGAMIRDGMKSVADLGACHETRWPYDIPKFRDRPGDDCYADALEHQAVTYYRVGQDLREMKGCLAAGYPFVFGFAVYESFESQEMSLTGALGLPRKGERNLGGHAVLAVGFDDSSRTFLVQNSWGADWGQQGFFTVPQEYLADSDLASDFWTIRMVEA